MHRSECERVQHRRAGAYSVEVSKLAQSQKLVATGQASATAAIGAGTLTFDFGTISGGTFDAVTGKYTGAGFASNGAGIKTVTIDASNNSLAGIRDASTLQYRRERHHRE